MTTTTSCTTEDGIAIPSIDTVTMKATSLLATGHLEVVAITPSWVHVRCRSASTDDIYELTADFDGWVCGCVAGQFRRRCSHIVAARLVVAGPGRRRLPPNPNKAGFLEPCAPSKTRHAFSLYTSRQGKADG